jgi:hypothetical protein
MVSYGSTTSSKIDAAIAANVLASESDKGDTLFEQHQQTDTHWRCDGGRPSWNWRCKWRMVAPITRENCRLTVQCWDQDIFSGNDMVGKCVINLYSAIRRAFATGAPVQYYDSLKAGDRVSITPSPAEMAKARVQRKGAKLKPVLGTVRTDTENGSFLVEYDRRGRSTAPAPARSVLDVVRSSASAAVRSYTAVRKAVGGQGQVSSVERYRLKRLPERYQQHEHAQLGPSPVPSSSANTTAGLLLARKPKYAKLDRERKLRAFRRGGRGAASQAASIAHDAAAASATTAAVAEAVATATHSSTTALVTGARKRNSMSADGSSIELKGMRRTHRKTKRMGRAGASLKEPLLDGASYGYGSMDEGDNYDDVHSSSDWHLNSKSRRSCEPAWLVRWRQARQQRAREARTKRAAAAALAEKRRRKHEEAMKQGGDGSKNETLDKLKRALGLDSKDLPPPDSAWVPIHRTDSKTGDFLPAGELCMMVRVVPISLADLTRSGLGRDEPNVGPVMPPPVGRLEFSFNPCFLLRELCGKQRFHSFQAICCCFIVLIFFIFVAGYLNNIVDFFHNIGSIF